MSVFVSHISALQVWSSLKEGTAALALHADPRKTPCWRTGRPLPQGKVALRDIQGIAGREIANLAFPLHVLVPDAACRSRSELAACHVSSSTYPRGSFVRLAEGVLVSSPELCFVQMATKLPPIALVRLGFELCGTYGIPTVARADYGFERPFTTVARLGRFIEAAGDMPGTVKARKALRFIASGSASPMETCMVMLLCLPLRLGGYNLPKPQMNREVRPKRRGRFAAEDRQCFCDLVWHEARVALEYDSSEFHGPRQAADDARRRNVLLNRGFTVVSVTSGSARNLIELDRIAQILRTRLGVRLRSGQPSWRARQHVLHGMLLENPRLPRP